MKAVILAGGGGSRLWPLSTNETPKQFQKLTSEKTMLEEAITRLDFLSNEDIYIAINEQHLELTKEICPQIPEQNIIIEPALRDTASCIGFAATIIEKRHPGEVMSIIYADHLITNKELFQEKLKLAAKIAAEKNTLNIIEVEATEPNTNYGYVKLAKKDNEIDEKDVYKLDHFVEKPNQETAKKFIESGNYLWNTGIFVWKAKTLLEQYKKHQPESYKKFEQIAEALATEKEKSTIDEVYPTLEKISLDFAIMEKVDPKKVRIIKASNLGWSDIGNWEAIYNELSSDKKQNIKRGKTESLDCEGCLIYSDNNKTIATIGLKDIVIVDTKDGLLVCKKDQAKRIKEFDLKSEKD